MRGEGNDKSEITVVPLVYRDFRFSTRKSFKPPRTTKMADTSAASSCRFSTRISLRWLPESAHETTDTIVMSVKDWYLDLRMDKQTQEIDWAIAGQRIVESQGPRMSLWPCLTY
jgi:hypothetical protein